MTIAEYSLRFKAFRLSKLDEELVIHKQAWANQNVKAKDKKGKSQYKSFKAFFDFEKHENEILGKTKKSVVGQDVKMMNILKKANL